MAATMEATKWEWAAAAKWGSSNKRVIVWLIVSRDRGMKLLKRKNLMMSIEVALIIASIRGRNKNKGALELILLMIAKIIDNKV